jgi:hypothetical protein
VQPKLASQAKKEEEKLKLATTLYFTQSFQKPKKMYTAAIPKHQIYTFPTKSVKNQGARRSRAPTALKCVGLLKWRRRVRSEWTKR